MRPPTLIRCRVRTECADIVSPDRNRQVSSFQTQRVYISPTFCLASTSLLVHYRFLFIKHFAKALTFQDYGRTDHLRCTIGSSVKFDRIEAGEILPYASILVLQP